MGGGGGGGSAKKLSRIILIAPKVKVVDVIIIKDLCLRLRRARINQSLPLALSSFFDLFVQKDLFSLGNEFFSETNKNFFLISTDKLFFCGLDF